jgi:LacI family transcriptional regulator
MNGKRHMPYKLLYKYREKFQQMNFLMHYESGIDFPDANIITFDYYKAGYLAGEHLLKAGHKKFAFISYYELPEAICRRNGCRSSAECHDMIMLSGMKAALDEAGIPASNITVIREPESIEEQEEIDFKELLKRGPLGIFAMGDSRVIGIYKTAVKIGIDIARDFNIVGLYNTSWAEVFHPTLSSISIKETEIAHLTADCIINRKTGCRIVIEPELIVRET